MDEDPDPPRYWTVEDLLDHLINEMGFELVWANDTIESLPLTGVRH